MGQRERAEVHGAAAERRDPDRAVRSHLPAGRAGQPAGHHHAVPEQADADGDQRVPAEPGAVRHAAGGLLHALHARPCAASQLHLRRRHVCSAQVPAR